MPNMPNGQPWPVHTSGGQPIYLPTDSVPQPDSLRVQQVGGFWSAVLELGWELGGGLDPDPYDPMHAGLSSDSGLLQILDGPAGANGFPVIMDGIPGKLLPKTSGGFEFVPSDLPADIGSTDLPHQPGTLIASAGNELPPGTVATKLAADRTVELGGQSVVVVASDGSTWLDLAKFMSFAEATAYLRQHFVDPHFDPFGALLNRHLLRFTA